MLTNTGHEIGGLTSISWDERHRLARASRSFVVVARQGGGIRVDHAEMLRQGWLPLLSSSEITANHVNDATDSRTEALSAEPEPQIGAAMMKLKSNKDAETARGVQQDEDMGVRMVEPFSQRIHKQRANEETKTKMKKKRKHKQTSFSSLPSSRTRNGAFSSLATTATTHNSPSFVLARVLQRNALWFFVGFCTLFAYLNIFQ